MRGRAAGRVQMFVQRCCKFRHVYGSAAKKEHCYEGLRFTRSAHDGSFCAVNPQFVAVVIESCGGGAFIILPLDKVSTLNYALSIHLHTSCDIKKRGIVYFSVTQILIDLGNFFVAITGNACQK